MKKITIITMSLLLFAGGLPFAQSTKYKTRAGIVKESTMKTDKNGKPKKIPLKGVIIETNEQARATSSDSGTFKLNISKAPFKITKAAKKDYIMLIPEAGKTTYHDGKDIIDILLVSKKTLNTYNEAQIEIARLAREKEKAKALKELQKKKDEGDISYGEYFQKEDSINQSYKEKMERIIEYIERSSKEFFKGMEQIDKQIDDCIIKGEIDKADSLIISKGYFNERIVNIEKLDETKLKLVADAVSDCLKKFAISRDRINYNEALAYLDTARVLQEEHFGLQDPVLALTYNQIGNLYKYKNNLDEALKWYDKALNIQEQFSDPLSPYLSITYNNIGAVYGEKRNYDEALKWLEKALRIQEQLSDSLNPDLAQLYNNIGMIYSSKLNLDEAMKWYDKALTIQEQVLDSLDADLAITYINIGCIYYNRIDLDEAMRWYDKSLKIREKVLNPLSPDLADLYSNIGMVYVYKSNYDEALKWLNKALRIQEHVLDPLSMDLVLSYNNMGRVYKEKGNYDEALKWHYKALKIQEQVLEPFNPDLSNSYSLMGIVYSAKGDFNEALKWANKALQLREKFSDSLDPALSVLYTNIGLIYFKMQNYSEALEYFNNALPGFIKNFGDEHKVIVATKQLIEQCKQALEK